MLARLVFLFFLMMIQVSWSAPVCEDVFREKSNRSAFGSFKFSWATEELAIATGKILFNISPADAKPGAILAGQTRNSPNYYFHWVRDAGIVADALLGRYKSTQSSQEKETIKRKLMEYLEFSEGIQNSDTPVGLGEVKFEVDGSPYKGEWGRPQTDGPALRAISFIHLVKTLGKENSLKSLRDRLYDGRQPTQSLIKKDLEYIAKNWKLPSYDVWEEVKGDHFFTRMVQRRALLEGAELAKSFGDNKAAGYYEKQAREIEKTITDFWNQEDGYFVATRHQVDGLVWDKKSNVDVAVLLGLVHGQTEDGFLKFSDPRVKATLIKIIKTFQDQYKINQVPGVPGVAIGRYPEDQFDGPGRSGGNPWVLATLTVAEV